MNTTPAASPKPAADSRLVQLLFVTALLLFLPISFNGVVVKTVGEAIADDYFAENDRVEVKGDRLSASLVDADLDEVLSEIGRQGNIKIVYQDPPDKKVTLSFDDLPMEKGLDALLQGQNFLLPMLAPMTLQEESPDTP